MPKKLMGAMRTVQCFTAPACYRHEKGAWGGRSSLGRETQTRARERAGKERLYLAAWAIPTHPKLLPPKISGIEERSSKTFSHWSQSTPFSGSRTTEEHSPLFVCSSAKSIPKQVFESKGSVKTGEKGLARVACPRQNWWKSDSNVQQASNSWSHCVHRGGRAQGHGRPRPDGANPHSLKGGMWAQKRGEAKKGPSRQSRLLRTERSRSSACSREAGAGLGQARGCIAQQRPSMPSSCMDQPGVIRMEGRTMHASSWAAPCAGKRRRLRMRPLSRKHPPAATAPGGPGGC